MLLLGGVLAEFADLSHKLEAFVLRGLFLSSRHGAATHRHFPKKRAIRFRGLKLRIGKIRRFDLDGLGAGTVPRALFAMAKHAIVRKELLRGSQSFLSGRDWILHLLCVIRRNPGHGWRGL